jgi:hypothetical protein
MDRETRDMLRTSLLAVLGERSERPLTDRLTDLGWDEVLGDDAPTALRTLFEVKGEVLSGANALGPLLAGAVADAAGLAEASGATVVLPSSLHPDRRSSRFEGGALVVDGVAFAAPGAGASLIVPVDDGGDGLRLVVAAAAELASRPVEGFDPDLGLAAVSASLDAAAGTWIKGPDAVGAWDAAVALGRWTLAAELVGIGRRVVAEAVQYTGERKQYGRPIGSFQALQHRLASAHASIVGASDVVAEAATSGSPWVALVAKALAGRAAEDACTQAQQSYGAIGFTWEHAFHRSLRRVYVLDRLLGGWRTLEPEIGARIQETRHVPAIGTL